MQRIVLMREVIYNAFYMGHFFVTISRCGRMRYDVQACNHASPPFISNDLSFFFFIHNTINQLSTMLVPEESKCSNAYPRILGFLIH